MTFLSALLGWYLLYVVMVHNFPWCIKIRFCMFLSWLKLVFFLVSWIRCCLFLFGTVKISIDCAPFFFFVSGGEFHLSNRLHIKSKWSLCLQHCTRILLQSKHFNNFSCSVIPHCPLLRLCRVFLLRLYVCIVRLVLSLLGMRRSSEVVKLPYQVEKRLKKLVPKISSS